MQRRVTVPLSFGCSSFHKKRLDGVYGGFSPLLIFVPVLVMLVPIFVVASAAGLDFGASPYSR